LPRGRGLDPSPFQSHAFPLREPPETLDAMAGRADGFLKATVRYD
jgi:hypothetical protein